MSTFSRQQRAPSGRATNVGTYYVKAHYVGDANHLPSDGAAVAITITAPAVSISGNVYVLNQTASGALTISGNAQLDVSGTLQVDSNSVTAVKLSGNADVDASQTQIVGGRVVTGNARFDHAVTTGAEDVADPLSALNAQTGSGDTAVTLSGNQTLILNPGAYSSITVSGNAHLILAPGTYIIGSGGVTVSGNAVVTGGQDVLIYNNGALTVSDNAVLDLVASDTGDFAGVAIFQSRTDSSPVTISGHAYLNLHGGFFYDSDGNSMVTFSGNAQVEASLAVNELTITGNSDDDTQ